MGDRAAQDLLKQQMFENKVTPVPPQEQLSVIERDQLEFFLKSPGIGMLFLSTSFFIAKTDLGAQMKSAAMKAIGNEMLSTVSDAVPSTVRKVSDAAAKKVTGKTNDAEDDDDEAAPYDYGDSSGCVASLLRVGRIILTIVMPLLLFGVQFVYIFFIFKEGYDNYHSGVCPGYDVPNKNRIDPGFGADTQVRILVGFIGAYFVFKNIAQLISYQRALVGNTKLKPLAQLAQRPAGIVGDVVAAATNFLGGGHNRANPDAEAAATDSAAVGVSGSNMGHHDEGSLKVADTRCFRVVFFSLDARAYHRLFLITNSKSFETLRFQAVTSPALRTVGSSWKIQDIKLSGMYFVYCLDIFFNLCVVFLVLMCNLYVVFVNGAGAQDVVTKVVILDFILTQQTAFKREIFSGNTGRVVLHALKKAYNITPETEGQTKKNVSIRNSFGNLLLLLGQVPIFLSLAFIMYGPICKPGIDGVASLNIKTGK